jgi:engulfment and cell motility protein 1
MSQTSAGPSQPKAALVPTNNVTTGDVTVRVRIDPTLTVDDVVRQLCINLKINGLPSDYALRDEADELVTNDNLRRKIKTKVNLKYVPFLAIPRQPPLTHDHIHLPPGSSARRPKKRRT